VVCESPGRRDGNYEVVVERVPGERRGASTLMVRDIIEAGPSVCVPLPE